MSDAAFPSRRGLTGDALKLLAVLAMTLDHIAWLLFPGYPAQAMPLAMHIIGRLTCPIMCYFIAEGYHYTRNFRRYALRLFLLAIVSHFAYIYASNAYQDWRSFIPFYSGSVLNQTGVVWSLLGGLLMLRVNGLEEGGADSASLSSDLSGRLELHCRAVHSVHRLKPGKSQKAASLVRVLRQPLRRSLLFLARPALRCFTAVRLPVRAAAAAL